MYTQCAKCETVFKLSAEVLRAAGGQVRCGRCGEVFNALARLAEDASAFSTGESPLEMETRADEILRSTVPAATEAAPPKQREDLAAADVEFARLQILDLELFDTDRPEPAAAKANDPPADASLEFTLPPGELDRIFVEPKPRAPQPARTADTERRVPPQSNVETVPPAAVEVPPNRTGIEVPDEVRREMLAGFKQGQLPEIAVPRVRSLPFAVWLSAAILLTVLLALQMIHENLAWFAAHAPLGGSLRTVYSAVGGTLPAPANLSAYQLRQWGVTGDPAANGTLRVRASILNTAPRLQPYPLLRVTLANRFGAPLGSREFEPAEYLGKPTVKMLAPGERVDAILDILDPGKDAEGFEIDVCLRGAHQRISCAGDAAAQTKQ
ncbi:MAG: DUF3426 domain-containing protein [Steroidobacteraceae bacterium]